MKWKFKDLTSNSLAVTIKEEIKDGVLSRFVVSIRDPTNDSGDIFQVICKEGKSNVFSMRFIILYCFHFKGVVAAVE